MRPTRLDFKGITTFEERTVIDFTELGNFFAIIGENGSGKSTILDAITHALFGRGINSGKGIHLIDLVSAKDKSASIRLRFDHRGNTYEVFRSTKNNQSNFKKAIPNDNWEKLDEDDKWEVLAERSENEVTTSIQNVLGMDLNLFNKTILIPHNDFGAIMNQDKKDRRETFSGIIKGDIYESMKNIADATKKELTAKLDRMQGAIEDNIRRINIPENQDQESGVITSISTNELIKIQKQKKGEGKEIKELIKEGVNAKEQLEKLISLLNDYQQKEQSQQESKERIHEYEKEITALEKIEKDYLKQITSSQQTLKKIEYVPNSQEALNLWKGHLDLEENRKAIEKKILATNEIRTIEELDNDLSQADIEIKNSTDKLSEIITYISTAIEKHKNTKKSLEAYLSNSNDLKQTNLEIAQIEKIIKSNKIAEILSELKIGDVCPICGNKISEINTVHSSEALPEEQYKQYKEQADTYQRQLLNIEEQLNEDIKNLEQLTVAEIELKIEENSDQIKSLMPIGAKYKEFMGENDLTIYSIELNKNTITTSNALSKAGKEATNRYTELSKYIGLGHEYLKLRPELKELEIQLAQYDEIIKKMKPSPTKIDNLIANIDKNQEQFEAIEEELEELKLASKEHKSDIDVKKGELKNETRRLKENEKSFLASKHNLQEIARAMTDILSQDYIDHLTKEKFNVTEEIDNMDNLEQDYLNAIEEKEEILMELGKELDALKEAIKIKKESSDLESEQKLYEEISESLNPASFPEYLLNQAIQNILSLSTEKIQTLSESMESIELNDNDDYVVTHNGEERIVKTLSGGEQAICSLAMLLGISEYIMNLQEHNQYMNLGSLLIDEAFTELDEENIEVVIQALEEISEERMIAIISHQDIFRTRLPSKIQVNKGATNKIEIL